MSRPDFTERMVPSSTGIVIQTFSLAAHPSSPSRKLAFIGHPLGRLGGTWRDPTVQAIGALCSRQGFDVIFICSRGRGKSGGWASFSAIPEAQDYQSVVDTLTTGRVLDELLLIGYSAGSLSALWSQPQVLRDPDLKVRRILISYPHSALWALTIWRTTPFVQRLHELASSPREQVLAVYGDCDEFTAKAAYQSWREDISAKGSAITFEEVQNANHFWFNGDDRKRLIGRIDNWLS